MEKMSFLRFKVHASILVGKQTPEQVSAEKIGKFMAGIGFGIFKIWRESTFRLESENSSEKQAQKKDRNPEFRGITAEFRRISQLRLCKQ